MVNLANIAQLMKIVYGPRIGRAIPEETTLLNWIESVTDKVWNKGLYYTEPVDLNRATGFGYRSGSPAGGTAATLPVEDTAASWYANRIVYNKTAYAKMKFDRRVLESTKDAPSVAAYAKIQTETMDKLKKACANGLDIHLYGNGSGVLAQYTEPAGALRTSVAVANYALGWQSGQTGGCSRYLEVGDTIGFYTNTGTLLGTTKTLTGVNRTTHTISWTGNLNFANGVTYYVCKADANGTEFAQVPEGLYSAIIATGNPANVAASLAAYQNIDPASYPRWAATNLQNSGVLRPLTFPLMEQACEIPTEVGDGPGPDFLLMHRTAKEEFVKLCDGDVRYVNIDMTFKRGVKKLLWVKGDKEIPLEIGRNCPYYTIFALDSTAFEWSILTDWHWVELDGTMMKYAGNDRDEYFAYMACDANLSCRMRNSNAVIRDIQVSPASFVV